MSYDIRFAVKVADHEDLYAVIGEPKYSSPTYNVGKIFRKCMDWDFEQGKWYKIQDYIPNIEKGIHEMKYNAEEYKYLEPDNGWGSTDSVLNCLQSIIEYLTEQLQWSWNGDIPIDCIYIAW